MIFKSKNNKSKVKIASYDSFSLIWHCGYCSSRVGISGSIDDYCGGCGRKVIVPRCKNCDAIIEDNYCTDCGIGL